MNEYYKRLYNIYMNNNIYFDGEARQIVIEYINHLGKINHCYPFDAERCYIEKIKENEYEKYFERY